VQSDRIPDPVHDLYPGKRLMKKYIGVVDKYYRDVVGEMKKVSWPTREEIKDLTVVVLTVSGVLALFTFFVDWVINSLMGYLL
jgi:preprotein translocase subunit SecE